MSAHATRQGLAMLACAALLSACGTTSAPTSTGASTTGSSPHAAPAAPTHVSVQRVSWRLPQAVARQAVTWRQGTSVDLAGGLLPGDASTGRAYRLDLTDGHVTKLPPLAVPVHDSAGGAFDGEPAVYGGGNASEQSTVQALTPHGWKVRAHLPTTRSDLSVVDGPGGSTYVLGGYDGAGAPKPVLRAHGSKISSFGRLRYGTRYAATARVGNAAYLFGGEINDQELGVVQRVDLTTGRTSVVGRLPHPLGHAMAMPVGGRILLVGGTPGYEVRTRTMWWFDPVTGHFTSAGRLPVPVSDAVLLPAPGGALLMGGQTGQGSGGETARVWRLSIR